MLNLPGLYDWQATLLSLQMFSYWIMELSLRSPSIGFPLRNPLGSVYSRVLTCRDDDICLRYKILMIGNRI